MKKMKKTALSICILVLSFTISYFFPEIKSLYHQTMDRELIERISNRALSANLEVIQLKYQSFGSSSSISTSPGASGVIFRKEGNKYYALTAEHVVARPENVDRIQIYVLDYEDLNLADSIKNGGGFQGSAEYYMQFPEATVEYASFTYDLAIISFTSNEDYTVLSIADQAPKFGDTVASMSNPYRQRNIIMPGRVNSRTPKPFGDAAGEMQHPIITHTASISAGSSGSALLNENLEIVGINLGGNENIFRKFVSGMAMPSDRIHDFLEEWEQSAFD